MSEIHLMKTAVGSMIAASEEDQDALKRFKVGSVVRFEAKQMRNYLFFRKWFALITFAFEQWSDTAEMPVYKGQRVQPNKKRFRKDITILAGYGYPVSDVNGNVHMEAESISFASMDEETFEKLYSATINVILQKILNGRGYTEEKLRHVVYQILSFA